MQEDCFWRRMGNIGWKYVEMNTDNPDKALEKESRYGRISAWLLMIAWVTIVLNLLCDPGWGSPFATLVALLIIFCFPASFILGIVGIIYDGRKLPAILTTFISGGLMIYWALSIGFWLQDNVSIEAVQILLLYSSSYINPVIEKKSAYAKRVRALRITVFPAIDLWRKIKLLIL